MLQILSDLKNHKFIERGELFQQLELKYSLRIGQLLQQKAVITKTIQTEYDKQIEHINGLILIHTFNAIHTMNNPSPPSMDTGVEFDGNTCFSSNDDNYGNNVTEDMDTIPTYAHPQNDHNRKRKRNRKETQSQNNANAKKKLRLSMPKRTPKINSMNINGNKVPFINMCSSESDLDMSETIPKKKHKKHRSKAKEGTHNIDTSIQYPRPVTLSDLKECTHTHTKKKMKRKHKTEKDIDICGVKRKKKKKRKRDKHKRKSKKTPKKKIYSSAVEIGQIYVFNKVGGGDETGFRWKCVGLKKSQKTKEPPPVLTKANAVFECLICSVRNCPCVFARHGWIHSYYGDDTKILNIRYPIKAQGLVCGNKNCRMPFTTSSPCFGHMIECGFEMLMLPGQVGLPSWFEKSYGSESSTSEKRRETVKSMVLKAAHPWGDGEFENGTYPKPYRKQGSWMDL